MAWILPRPTEAFRTPRLPFLASKMSRHSCTQYRCAASLTRSRVRIVTGFIGGGWKMPLARIITSQPEHTAAISRKLQQQGFSVEIARPEDQQLPPADLEIQFELCDQ